MTDDRSTPDPIALLAQVDEAEALVSTLRARTHVLNAEVRLRDQRIEDLQGEIADLSKRLDAIEAKD